MSHDRCYDHKCRACSKCAETLTVTFPSGIEAKFEPGDAAYVLAQEVERLRVVVDQEARARQHAESEVARLKSYIANGVGGAS